jgi:acyl-CoA thioester hydrolase
MFTHSTQIRVRYYETDRMGFMHHSNYARYYEIARTDASHAIGFPYAKAEASGYIMPVVKIESKFMKSLTYDDLVTVKTYIKEMPRFGMLTFHHEFFNEQNELVHTGSITLAMVNTVTNKRENGPAEMIAEYAKFFP